MTPGRFQTAEGVWLQTVVQNIRNWLFGTEQIDHLLGPLEIFSRHGPGRIRRLVGCRLRYGGPHRPAKLACFLGISRAKSLAKSPRRVVLYSLLES